VQSGDTVVGAFDLGSFASRVTVASGWAIREAAKEINEKLKAMAGAMLGCRADQLIIKDRKIYSMFEVSLEMLKEALEAFDKEDNQKAMSIFAKDSMLDEVNKSANKIIARLIKEDPKDILNLLDLLSVIRKLERVGDQTKNISEEIIFYIEAKQIRHSKSKKAQKADKSKEQ
jgi:phosphate uptake regulator